MRKQIYYIATAITIVFIISYGIIASLRMGKENISQLKSINMSDRIVPHNINTLSNFDQIYNTGSRSFELDVHFRENEGGYFEVGHDSDNMTGVSLKTFLESIPNEQINKIWLDIKNCSSSNINQIRFHLQNLDALFHFKQKLIVETSYIGSEIKELSCDGFHTSYYLPTNTILDLIIKEDYQQMEALAIQISLQTEKQKLKACSFHIELYPFVKEHLENHISDNLVYHCWDLSLKIKDWHFIDNLKSKVYYQDTRLKTILIRFK
ncbi:MAG: hypothetical protein JEZ03_03040 [Bacteroidales bacterium]|nr:hypothetical protein [Bacteroidales bacterium]